MSGNRIGNNTPKQTLPPTPGNVAQEGTEKVSDTKGTNPASIISALSSPTKNKTEKGNFDVNISNGAKDRAVAFQKAFDIAKQTPDIREDRVKTLKEQIQNGTYKLDAGNIADGMLLEAVKDRLAETEPR